MPTGRDKFLDTRHPENVFKRVEDLEREIAAIKTDYLPNSTARAVFVRRGHDQVFDGWYQATVDANQTAEILNRFGSAVAYLQALAFPVSGSVLGIGVVIDAARTGGTLTVTVYTGTDPSAVASDLQAVIDEESTLYNIMRLAPGMVKFSAGEDITVRLTTDSTWAPTSANIQNVFLWVQLDE